MVRYRAFHRFGQAKIHISGKVLGLNQFLLLHQLPQKTILGLKVVKTDSKIAIWLCQAKSVTRLQVVGKRGTNGGLEDYPGNIQYVPSSAMVLKLFWLAAHFVSKKFFRLTKNNVYSKMFSKLYTKTAVLYYFCQVKSSDLCIF